MAAIETPENEFSQVPERFAALGQAAGGEPEVSRRWVNVSTGGHVSGVVWGSGSPEVVLIHRSGTEARTLDEVAMRLARPVVVLDLPGSGRSSGPATRPRRAGPLLAEAAASFAPRARLIAGIGDGGLAALGALRRRPEVQALLLLDALPELPDVDADGTAEAAPNDDRVLWDQLATSTAAIEVGRTEDGGLSEAQLAYLAARRPDAVVSGIDSSASALEHSGAGAISAVLLAAMDRLSDR